MNTKTKYSYTILRYVHDLVTGEFVNMGVVLFSPDAEFLRAKLRHRSRRVTQFFPEARGSSLTRTLSILEKNINRAGERLRSNPHQDLFKAMERDVMSIARAHIPFDDSGFQWSPVRGGLSVDLSKTLDDLFDRLVTRYDEPSTRGSRSDDEVWKSFSRVLNVRRLEDRIIEHEIESSIDTVHFDKALKNGKWHLLEPVSFDLMDGATIKKKAQQIVGQMTVLKDSSEDFDVYLLVGEPQSADVKKDYEIALRTLDTIPISKHVYPESKAEDFGKKISAVMADAE